MSLLSDLKQFDRIVTEVVTEAVNDHGVNYRAIDGGHIRLFNGDRGVVPLKLAASRPAENQLRYLLDWLETNVPSWAERTVTESSLKTLKAAVDTTPKKEVVVKTEQWTDVKWGFQTNGKIWRCKECGYEREDSIGLHLHARVHNETPEQRAERSKKAGEANALKRTQRATMLKEAARLLAEEFGVSTGEDEITKLKEQVARLTKERDEAVARLALIKEAMKA